MASLSRRMFLVRSSMVAAAAGVASSVPGLSGIITSAAPEAPAVDGAAADALSGEASVGAADASQPLVAHVRDLSTGEIGVFNGTREVVVRDPELAGRIFRAAR